MSDNVSIPAETVRHFLADDDLSPQEQAEVLARAAALKAAPFSDRSLEGPQVVSILFDKPTLRTQVSFVGAVAHLGGQGLAIEEACGHGRLPRVVDAEDVHDAEARRRAPSARFSGWRARASWPPVGTAGGSPPGSWPGGG